MMRHKIADDDHTLHTTHAILSLSLINPTLRGRGGGKAESRYLHLRCFDFPRLLLSLKHSTAHIRYFQISKLSKLA